MGRVASLHQKHPPLLLSRLPGPVVPRSHVRTDYTPARRRSGPTEVLHFLGGPLLLQRRRSQALPPIAAQLFSASSCPALSQLQKHRVCLRNQSPASHMITGTAHWHMPPPPLSIGLPYSYYPTEETLESDVKQCVPWSCHQALVNTSIKQEAPVTVTVDVFKAAAFHPDAFRRARLSALTSAQGLHGKSA